MHSPATQRLAVKCLPISFTAVNKTLFTLAWRYRVRVISLMREKLSAAAFSSCWLEAGA